MVLSTGTLLAAPRRPAGYPCHPQAAKRSQAIALRPVGHARGRCSPAGRHACSPSCSPGHQAGRQSL